MVLFNRGLFYYKEPVNIVLWKCSYSPLPPPNSWGCTSAFPLCIKVEIWAQEWLHSGWQWWPGTTQENQPEWANLKTCSFLPGLWNPPESNPEEEQKKCSKLFHPASAQTEAFCSGRYCFTDSTTNQLLYSCHDENAGNSLLLLNVITYPTIAVL